MRLVKAIGVAVLLSACAVRGQNIYGDHEVGIGAKVVSGTVLRERDVEIIGLNGVPTANPTAMNNGGLLVGLPGEVMNGVVSVVGCRRMR